LFAPVQLLESAPRDSGLVLGSCEDPLPIVDGDTEIPPNRTQATAIYNVGTEWGCR